MKQVRDGSQLLVDSVMDSHPNYPKIPVTFGAYTLTQIHFSHGLEVIYLDFSPVSDYLYLTVDNVSADDQKYFSNLSGKSSEVWQIKNTPILFSGCRYLLQNHHKFQQYILASVIAITFTLSICSSGDTYHIRYEKRIIAPMAITPPTTSRDFMFDELSVLFGCLLIAGMLFYRKIL